MTETPGNPLDPPAVVPPFADPYVMLAAANLVTVMRGWSGPIRDIIQAYFAEVADRRTTVALSRLYAALDVLLGEVRAEEVRVVGRAVEDSPL